MNTNGAENKRIAKNTVLLCVRMVIVLIISLYTSRVVLAALGVEDFGIYNVVAGFVTMFSFLNSAMSTGIQRFYNTEIAVRGTDGANRVYITAIQTQFLLALITLLLVETIGLWYIYHKMVIPTERFDAALFIFHMSTISMVMMMMQVPYTAAIMAHEKMDFYALLGIVDHVFKLLAVIVLPYLPGDNLKVYGLLIMSIGFLNLLASYAFSKIKFPEIRIKFTFYRSLFWEMLSFSGWNVFGKFANVMGSQGLNMLLNLFYGPVVNAARGIAYQVKSAVSGFVANINVAVKPQLTQSYAIGDYNRTFNLMFSISKVNYFVLFVLSLPICLEVESILHLWLGENVPNYTAIFIILVFAASLVGTLHPPISFVVHATGEMKRFQLVTTLVDLLSLPLSYFALKMGAGPQVVFIISIVFNVIVLAVSLILLQEIVYYSIKRYISIVILPLLWATMLSMVIPLSIRLFIPDGLFRLFFVLLISLLSSFCCFYFLALNQSERALVRQFIRSFLNKYFHHERNISSRTKANTD